MTVIVLKNKFRIEVECANIYAKGHTNYILRVFQCTHSKNKMGLRG